MAERDAACAEVIAMTAERDEARAEVVVRTTERETDRAAYEARVGELDALVSREVPSVRTAREVQRQTIGHHLDYPCEVQDHMTTVEIERNVVTSQLQDGTKGEDGQEATCGQRDAFRRRLEEITAERGALIDRTGDRADQQNRRYIEEAAVVGGRLREVKDLRHRPGACGTCAH